MVKTGILSKGQIVNNTYEIQSLIGRGGFGEVYKVKHKYLGIQVLKVFQEEYVKASDVDTLMREARILSGITHPNIVRVFETNTFTIDLRTFFYLTMSFVSGETLAQLLKRKIQLPLPIALTIQTDVLKGLQLAHEQKSPIVHRDISPDNVLLSYEADTPKAMLSDFGLAQFFGKISSIPGGAGKYLYMAPECFWGSYLLASDVFSAGVVLYQMLTGIMPWEYELMEAKEDSDSRITSIISARKKEPRNPSLYCKGCSKEIGDVVLRSLSIDLEKRFRNAGEFLEAIDGARRPREISKRHEQEGGHKHLDSKMSQKVRTKNKGFDLIAGMNAVKDILLQDVILPLKEKELYDQYKISIPNGVLFYGPPGCGKTFIAEKFAEEIELSFFQIKPSDLASIYVHGTQEKIGQLFRKAKEKAPAIIFIDELDAIVPARDSGINHSYASEVNELLAQLTECNEYGIFVIGATNRPENIDPAILRTGRMDKVIYIGPPDYDARVEMFKLYLSERPTEQGIDFSTLAKMTENYVSSDIKYIINEASRSALKEREQIKQRHLEHTIAENPPSISEKQIQRYEKFKKNRSFL